MQRHVMYKNMMFEQQVNMNVVMPVVIDFNVCVFNLQNHQTQNIQARIRAVRKSVRICNTNAKFFQKHI